MIQAHLRDLGPTFLFLKFPHTHSVQKQVGLEESILLWFPEVTIPHTWSQSPAWVSTRCEKDRNFFSAGIVTCHSSYLMCVSSKGRHPHCLAVRLRLIPSAYPAPSTAIRETRALQTTGTQNWFMLREDIFSTQRGHTILPCLATPVTDLVLKG